MLRITLISDCTVCPRQETGMIVFPPGGTNRGKARGGVTVNKVPKPVFNFFIPFFFILAPGTQESDYFTYRFGPGLQDSPFPPLNGVFPEIGRL